MAFEEAKQNFETKTNQAPQKVEGDWKNFKAAAEGYLKNKQKEVSTFIDRLEYPGKDQDKNNYLVSMNKALDNLIDENEATKKEMVEYNGVLYGKSNEFKNKLLVERAAMEVRETKAKLTPTVSYFEGNGLPIDISDNVKTYLSLPQDKRMPLPAINSAMENLFKDARNFLPRGEITKNKNSFYTILNHYSWGNTEAAKKETDSLKDYMDFFKKCENVRQKTGLKINNEELNGIMYALLKTGVDKKNVDEFIIKNTEKLKKLDEKSFNSLTSNLNEKSLSRFLLTAIISVNEGKTADAMGGIKLTLLVESTILDKQKKVSEGLKKVEGYLKQEVADLKKYQKENPNVSIDEKMASLYKEISESIYSIESHKNELVLISAKRSLANSYLGMKDMKPSSKDAQNTINAILNSGDSQALEKLAVDKCGFAKIPQLDLLRASELRVGMAKQEFDVKEWYAKNPKIDGDIDLHAVLRSFYETGNLTQNGRVVFKEQLGYQGKALKDLVNKNLENETDGALYFDSITKTNLNISNVPKEELETVSQRLTGYMSLLKNLHAANAKYVGNQESLLLLYPGNKEIQKEIKSAREKGEYLATQFKKVAKFAGLTGPMDLHADKIKLDTDSLAESQLFGPLIQKEISPHFRTMQKDIVKIQDAAAPIPGIGKRIETQAKQYRQLVTYRFEEGIGQMLTLTGNMEGARNNAINIIAQLKASINDPSKLKGMPQSMILQRKQYIETVIKNIEAALKDPKSPLSLEAIKKVKEQTNKVIKARDKYIREGVLRGVAIAVMMGVAVGAAVAGGWAAAGIGAKLFGTTATGTFAAGIIPVGVGVSKFAIGSTVIMGAAGGGVIGSRAVMSGFDALGLVDFGGLKKIWNPDDLLQDYATSLVFSLLAVGAAKGLMTSLKHVSTSQYFAFRFPGLVKFSRTAIDKMQVVSKVANPSGWFKSGKGVDTGSVLNRFGAKVSEEISEEVMESGLGTIHPALEFIASVANSADGVNMKFTLGGIKAADVGLVTEGAKMSYTTKTPQEFVANFKKEFQSKLNTGISYETAIKSDGTVEIDFITTDIDPKTGKQVIRKFTTVDVHPAKFPTNLTPEVEMARVDGLSKIEGKENSYTLTNTETSMSAFADLYNRGFNIVKSGENTFKVSKGTNSFELNVPGNLIEANKTKVESWTNTPIKKAAFAKFMEMNGNYQAILKKHPNLAKILPGDLLKMKVIPAPIMGLACGGLAFDMKSLEQMNWNVQKSEMNLNNLVNKADFINSNIKEQTLDVMGVKENRNLVRETYFDSATGLMNRNGLALGEKLLIEGKKMSIANFDADHFRASNEIKSREYGDAQIKIIAKNINQVVMELRSEGHQAYGVRMGGEEFTIMTTAPRGLLHKKMLSMSTKSKQEMLSTLSKEDKENMAKHIAETKYADNPNGVEKAMSELGGISGSVIGVDGKTLDKSQKNNMKKSLMFADAAMEDLKNKHGRGKFHLDANDPGATSKKINKFKIHNVLNDVQKSNLNTEVKRLSGKAEYQFDSRLKLTNSVINNIDPANREAFGSELKKTLSSPDSTIADIGKVLSKYGANVSLAGKLQSEYVSNLKDHGTYTGANTMGAYQKEILRPGGKFNAQNSWELEVGKFKSINETLGHVGGDMYLTFVYQDVILNTAKDLGINVGKNGDIVIAQKGANFRFCFSSEYMLKNPGIEAKFQAALNAKYQAQYKSLISKLNKESGKDYQQERDSWLKKNEASNPNSLKQQYNLYFNKS